jgi:hypothetical protein
MTTSRGMNQINHLSFYTIYMLHPPRLRVHVAVVRRLNPESSAQKVEDDGDQETRIVRQGLQPARTKINMQILSQTRESQLA